MKMIKNRDNFIDRVWVILFFSITLFVFEPTKIYLNNINDFWFTFDMIFPLLLMVGILTFIFGIIFNILITKISLQLTQKLTIVIFGIVFGFYMQSNIIPNSTGSFDGTQIDWSDINIDMIFSIILWLVILALIIFFILLSHNNEYRKEKLFRVFRTFSICVILLEIVTIVSLIIIHPNFNEKSYLEVTDDKEFEFSRNKNMIILLLDSYDSQYFMDGITDETKETFRDFTYYPDTTSKYGHTDLSLPQIITSKCYLNEQPFISYMEEAYEESSLLNQLMEEEWSVGLYTDSNLPKCELLSKCINLKENEYKISSRKRLLQNMYQLSMYNVVPYPMKRFFWFYPDFSEFKMSSSDDYDKYTWSNQNFNERITTASINSNQPSFRLYHLKGMHAVFETNSDGYDVGFDVGIDETREGNRTIINNLIDELKALGIYDDTIIVIMADHGDTNMLSDGTMGFGGMSESVYEYRQNPLLMVKGLKEHHELVISNNPVSYDGLKTAYVRLLNGEVGEKVFDKEKNRIFYKHAYTFKGDPKEYFSNIEEYEVSGYAWETDKLIYTGKTYSEGN